MEKPYYRRKTPLVVGGTQTQVLAASIAIAASALNHCATKPFTVYIYEDASFIFKLNNLLALYRYEDVAKRKLVFGI